MNRRLYNPESLGKGAVKGSILRICSVKLHKSHSMHIYIYTL